jgi:hypothetical protein
MYYVIAIEYVGPNPQDHVNDDTIGIYTEPARANLTGEARTSGWCGTTNDRATYAHGEYHTLEGARTAIMARGPHREADRGAHDAEETCVELYTRDE